MKRIFALLLAALLIASSLTSCKFDLSGGEEKAGEDAVEKEKDDEKTEADKTEAEVTEPEETETVFMPVEKVYDDFKKLHLVPRIITAERMEGAILPNIDDEIDKDRFLSFYTKYDVEEWLSESFKVATEIVYAFPIARNNAVYVLQLDIEKKELKTLEDIITKHCPEYTYNHMAADYLLCGYTQEEILSGEAIGREYSAVPEFVKEKMLVPAVMPAQSFDNMLIACFNSAETEVRDQLADSYIFVEAGGELPASEYYEAIIEDYDIVTLYDAYVLREDIWENSVEYYNLQDIYVNYCNYDHQKLFQNMIHSGYFWFD